MTTSITCQVEAWGDCRSEIAAHWPEHWREVALMQDQIALDPDMASYEDHAASGRLHVVTARKRGELVGYHLSIVQPHLHYRGCLSAFTDIYWLRPDCRRGYAGINLFREAERSLKARGVQKMFTGTKLHLDRGPIFERLGWTEAERLFVKYIGD